MLPFCSHRWILWLLLLLKKEEKTTTFKGECEFKREF